MMRRAAHMVHVVPAQFRLELREAPPTGVLPPVVGEHLLGRTVLPGRLPVDLQHVLGRLAAVEPQRGDVPRVVVDEPDDVGIAPQNRADRDVALPHPVGRRALEPPLNRLGLPARLRRRRKHDRGPLQFPPYAPGARLEQETTPQQVRDPPHAPRGLFALERNDLLAHLDGQLRPSRASLPVHQPRRPPLPVLLDPAVQRLRIHPRLPRHQRHREPILHVQPHRLQPFPGTVRPVHRRPLLRRSPSLLLLFRLHEFHSRPTAAPPGMCHPLLPKSHTHYLVASPPRRSIGGRILRRRECRNCERRVTTYEAAVGQSNR